MVLSKDQGQSKMQELLASMDRLINEMAEVAHANCVERVDFRGLIIHFGTRFDGDYPRDENGRVTDYSREIGGVYVPAVSGPVINDQYWSASSFDCWPTDEMNSWMFGEDKSSYRRTDYNDDAYELGRWPKGLPPGSIAISNK